MFGINTDELRNRLRTAYDMARHGAWDRGLEYLVYGNLEDDDRIRTQTPLYKNANFNTLIADIGLDFLTDDDFTPGDPSFYDFQNQDAVSLSTNCEKKDHVCHLTISGRTFCLYMAIKENPDLNVYQIDDAFIGEKTYSVEYGEDEDDYIFTLSIDEDEVGKELLPAFLSIFANTARTIVSDTEEISPQELEVNTFKKLKPIMDTIESIEEERMAQYEAQIAAMPGTPPTPSA